MKDRPVLYRAVEHMNTNQFCGQTCHVMKPEFTAHAARHFEDAGTKSNTNPLKEIHRCAHS